MSVRCFYLEPLRRARLSLRRFTFGNEKDCPSSKGGHDARVAFIEVDETLELNPDTGRKIYRHAGPHTREEVPNTFAWPAQCEGCSYIFVEDDEWQIFSETLYRRADTGETMTWNEAGPGAMRHCEWYEGLAWACGPDGLALSVKCPNGREWHIDGTASNCTKPDDKVHKCWCRSGIPPNITVDKNCNSCAAGAGSIQAGDYHGFLRAGQFVP